VARNDSARVVDSFCCGSVGLWLLDFRTQLGVKAPKRRCEPRLFGKTLNRSHALAFVGPADAERFLDQCTALIARAGTHHGLGSGDAGERSENQLVPLIALAGVVISAFVAWLTALKGLYVNAVTDAPAPVAPNAELAPASDAPNKGRRRPFR
jgi:hypothetical protein